MGAGASSGGPWASDERSRRQGLGELPESCVASVLVHLDPPEICAVARLNRAFRGAATADLVWKSKLPENYVYLMKKVAALDEKRKEKSLSKKEIYALLCHQNRFDGGKKIFWLEKCKGGVCMEISSKALSITGIDDRRYWIYIPSDESRFHSVAYLQQIWWFEVAGEIDFCFPAGTYSLFFRFHLGRPSKRLGHRVCNLEHIHGWNLKPVRFQLSTSQGHHSLTQCYLDEPGNWIHHHVGDFVVENSNLPTKVKFSMVQIDCTHAKGGVCVDSVSIYPTGIRPEKSYIR